MSNDIWWLEQYEDEGLCAFTMMWPKRYWPKVIPLNEPFLRKWKTTLPRKIVLDHVWTFIGFDLGDCAEVTLEIEASHGAPLLRRGLHKEGIGIWEPWERRDIPAVFPPMQKITVVTGCATTRPNVWTVTHGSKLEQSRFHVGIRIVGIDPIWRENPWPS